MYCIRHIQNSGIFKILNSLFFQVYAAIFNLFTFIQAYSAPCVTLAYLQPCCILNSSILRTGGLFETLWNLDQTYSEPCLRALFSHIQNLVQRLHIQKSDILRTLEYSRLFHNCILTHSEPRHIYENLRIFRNLIYLKPDTYLEPSQIFKMEFLQKYLKTVIIFPKRCILDLWTGSEYAMHFMRHIENSVYYQKFRHIKAYSSPIKT